MGLRLVTGGANTGKTGVALSAFRQWRSEGRSPVLVVPASPDVAQYGDELAAEGALGAHIKTPQSLLGDLWDRFGDGRELISAVQRDLLMRAAAAEAEASVGMARLATRCVGALTEQTGEAWRTKTDRVVDSDARVLQATLCRYAAHLSQHKLIEPGEAAAVVSSQILEAPPHVLHRFSDLTAWQLEIIRALARVTDVIVTLTWEEGSAATRALDHTIAALGVEPEPISGDAANTERELVQFAEALFVPGAEVSRDGAVGFGLADGEEAQARLAAEYAWQVMTEYGNTESLAVAFRDLDRHYSVVRRVFSQMGLNAVYDARMPLASVGFGAAYLNLLMAAASNDRSALLELLRSGYSGVEAARARELERGLRRRGVESSRAMMGRLWAEAPELAGVLDKVNGASELRGSALAARLAAAAAALFAHASVEGGATERLRWDAASQARIVGLLTEVAALGDSSVALYDVLALLGATTVTLQEEVPPGWIWVTSADRLRHKRFDHVILAGLNVGEFPVGSPESGLPGTAVHDVLVGLGANGIGEKSIDHERLLFASTVTRARKGLLLVACSVGSDGDALQVSPFFQEAADPYRDAKGAITCLRRRGLAPAPRADSLVERERLRHSVTVNPESGRAKAAVRRAAAGRYTCRIDTQELAAREVFSASEIESYLTCPYRWFFERHLRADELEQVADARDQGTFAHLILNHAYGELAKQGKRRLGAADIRGIGHLVDDAWALADEESGDPGSLGERIGRAAVKPWVAQLLRSDVGLFPGFEVTHLEWAFGAESDAIDLGGFSLRGRVDRIDIDASNRAVVIDYKLSKPFSAAQIVKQRKVQIPLYMAAVRAGLGADPVAGLYRGLRERCDRGIIREDLPDREALAGNDVRDAKAFDALIDDALGLSREAVEGIRAGHIPRDPHDANACAWCSASQLCGRRS